MIIGPHRDYYEYDKGNGDKRPLDMFLNPIMDERGYLLSIQTLFQKYLSISLIEVVKRVDCQILTRPSTRIFPRWVQRGGSKLTLNLMLCSENSFFPEFDVYFIVYQRKFS